MTDRKWYPSNFKGIRYRVHPERKHGIKFDRYYMGSFRFDKKLYQSSFGWQSEGWTEKEAFERISQYKKNAKVGEGPTSIKEEYELIQAEKERLAMEKEKEESLDNPQNVTVKLFYDRVYKNWAKGEKKASTANGEATYFHNYIFQVIGEKKIIDLVEEDFRSLRDYIIQEKNLSPRTVEQCFDIFKSVWKCATQKKLVNWNCPTRDVKLPRVENQRTRFFSYEEYFVLMAELKKRSIDVHDMAMFSIHTGARRGEIFDLAVSVVDVKNKSCILRDGKGKPRHAFLTDDVLEMVERRIKNKQQHERLFTNRAGDRYVDMPRTFARAVDALGFNDGVKDMRDKAVFHTCRHTFASWHVQNGTDLYEVCKLMGHSSIQVTERYAHLRPDGLKLAAERFNGILRRD